jgi:uncharacterized protein
MLKSIFAHGLESSPDGTKATYLRQTLDTTTPPLGHLELPDQVETLIGLMKDQSQVVLVGSSLGGLTALGASIALSETVAHLVLLAPAVGVWRKKDAFAQAHKTRPSLLEDVRRFSDLSIPKKIPTTIIHGFEDDVVALADVSDLAHRSQSARLLLVHDDHSLHSSKELILSVVSRAVAGNDPAVF